MVFKVFSLLLFKNDPFIFFFQATQIVSRKYFFGKREINKVRETIAELLSRNERVDLFGWSMLST